MYADWGRAARAFITKIAEDFSEETSLDTRRKTLKHFAGEFHAGTSHGRKVWSRECRRYLEQHGLPPIDARTVKPSAKQAAKMNAPDIAFPFRGQE